MFLAFPSHNAFERSCFGALRLKSVAHENRPLYCKSYCNLAERTNEQVKPSLTHRCENNKLKHRTMGRDDSIKIDLSENQTKTKQRNKREAKKRINAATVVISIHFENHLAMFTILALDVPISGPCQPTSALVHQSSCKSHTDTDKFMTILKHNNLHRRPQLENGLYCIFKSKAIEGQKKKMEFLVNTLDDTLITCGFLLELKQISVKQIEMVYIEMLKTLHGMSCVYFHLWFN